MVAFFALLPSQPCPVHFATTHSLLCLTYERLLIGREIEKSNHSQPYIHSKLLGRRDIVIGRKLALLT